MSLYLCLNDFDLECCLVLGVEVEVRVLFWEEELSELKFCL